MTKTDIHITEMAAVGPTRAIYGYGIQTVADMDPVIAKHWLSLLKNSKYLPSTKPAGQMPYLTYMDSKGLWHYSPVGLLVESWWTDTRKRRLEKAQVENPPITWRISNDFVGTEAVVVWYDLRSSYPCRYTTTLPEVWRWAGLRGEPLLPSSDVQKSRKKFIAWLEKSLKAKKQ
jgi:hypothetical protein